MERSVLDQIPTALALIGVAIGVAFILGGAVFSKFGGQSHPVLILIGLIVSVVSLFFLCTPTMQMR